MSSSFSWDYILVVIVKLTVQCLQVLQPVRWCKPWAYTRTGLAVCRWGWMLRYNQIYWRSSWRANWDTKWKHLGTKWKKTTEQTCGGVHKDSSILQCPVNISHHWPNVPEQKGEYLKMCFLIMLEFEHQPAAVWVASHFFGFYIFLHSVLPVLLVAL